MRGNSNGGGEKGGKSGANFSFIRMGSWDMLHIPPWRRTKVSGRRQRHTHTHTTTPPIELDGTESHSKSRIHSLYWIAHKFA